MLLTIERKLYLNATQIETLERWLRVCCGVYNRALDQRIKAWKRRKQSVKYSDQQALLTKQRARIEALRVVPSCFESSRRCWQARRLACGGSGLYRKAWYRAASRPVEAGMRTW